MADDDIRITFSADTAQAQSGIQQVKDEISGIKAPTDDLKNSFDDLKDTIVAAFSVGAIKNFVESFADLGTQITRMEAEFNMSAEAVQEWRYAMQATGGEAGNFQTAMVRLQFNMDAALEGSKRQQAAFKELGISTQDLKDHYGDLNTIALMMADGFQKLHAEGGGASEILTLMGRGAGSLIPLFSGGASAVQDFQQKALATGGVLDDTLVAALKDTHEKIIDMSSAITGAGAQAFRLFKPEIDAVIDGIEILARAFNVLVSTINFGAQVIDQSLRIIADAFTLNFTKAQTHIKELQKDWDEYVKNVQNTAGQGVANNPAKKAGTGAPGGKDEYEEDVAFDKQDIADKLALEKIYLEQNKVMEETKVAEGKISKEQSLADQKDFLTQQYQLEQQALQAESETYGLSEQEYQKVLDQKAQLTAKYNLDVMQMNLKSIQAQKQEYASFFQSINQGISQMVAGILQGTQTWQQAMAKLFDNLLVKFIDDFVVKRVTAWAQSELTMTSASTSADAARTASSTAAATATSAAQRSSDAATITADSGVTFAGVFANLAPTLGPAAAGPAEASQASVLAQLSTLAAPSFDVGSYNVPSDMLANIHQGEMIIPSSFADSLRNGEGGFGGGQSVNVTINAVDAQSVSNLLKSNSNVIAQIVQQNVRNFNSNTMAAARTG